MNKEPIDFKGASLTEKDCCICFDCNPDAVIMECGHGGICYECGKQILAGQIRVCHLCREDITYIIKMDLKTVYSNFIKVICASYVEDTDSDDDEDSDEGYGNEDNNTDN